MLFQGMGMTPLVEGIMQEPRQAASSALHANVPILLRSNSGAISSPMLPTPLREILTDIDAQHAALQAHAPRMTRSMSVSADNIAPQAQQQAQQHAGTFTVEADQAEEEDEDEAPKAKRPKKSAATKETHTTTTTKQKITSSAKSSPAPPDLSTRKGRNKAAVQKYREKRGNALIENEQLHARIAELESQVSALTTRVAHLQAENAALRAARKM